MPVLASPSGIAHYAELLTEDFRLEDPTAQSTADSREKMRASLMNALATGHYGPFHWDIERTVADGEWVAVEGTWRGVYKGRPFATRFSTWLQVRADRVARQIDYVDYDRAFIAPSFTWQPNADTTLTVLTNYQYDDTGWTIQFYPAEGTLFRNPNGKIHSNRFTGEPHHDYYKNTQYSAGYLFEHNLTEAMTVDQAAEDAAQKVKDLMGGGGL